MILLSSRMTLLSCNFYLLLEWLRIKEKPYNNVQNAEVVCLTIKGTLPDLN